MTLRDMVELAQQVLGRSKGRLNLPLKESWRPLRDSVITLETLSQLLSDANPKRQTVDSVMNPPVRQSPETFRNGPIFFVHASPWTQATNDDGAVSHLISLFLAFINPLYRFVEEDLFLQAMRSGSTDSKYCSCFLVNAILASASVLKHSKHCL